MRNISEQPPFPPPVYMGRRRVWALSEMLEYEAKLAGRAAEQRRAEDEVYLTASQVRERYGDVSDMTLWRWIRAGREEEVA